MAPKKPKPEVDPKRCENCEFFYPLEGTDNAGECFRNPPLLIPMSEDDIQSFRPIVFNDDRVCGEFKRKLDS